LRLQVEHRRHDERGGCVAYVMWGITSGSATLVFTLGPLKLASEMADIPEAGHGALRNPLGASIEQQNSDQRRANRP